MAIGRTFGRTRAPDAGRAGSASCALVKGGWTPTGGGIRGSEEDDS